jgi:hypothetical protein
MVASGVAFTALMVRIIKRHMTVAEEIKDTEAKHIYHTHWSEQVAALLLGMIALVAHGGVTEMVSQVSSLHTNVTAFKTMLSGAMTVAGLLLKIMPSVAAFGALQEK